MFPSRGDLHVAPFQDEALYMEQINKVNFWYQDYFHGVNLSCLRDAAMKEYFRQPIVSSIVSKASRRRVLNSNEVSNLEYYLSLPNLLIL
jgi:hypothetical protein